MHLGVQHLPGIRKDPDPATIWNIATVEDLPMSAFLGKADLEDCISLEEFDFAKEDYPFDIPDRGWVWIFSNPWKMLHPKMHPGKLGVFETL